MKNKINFVGLHAHSLSIFDSIGYPKEHMSFVWENGGTALAITDHGHMNAVPYQISQAKKMNEEGKEFTPIFRAQKFILIHPLNSGKRIEKK